MIPDERLQRMAAEVFGAEHHSMITNQAVKFARSLEKEFQRNQMLENTRMGCLVNGGHDFVIKGKFRSIGGNSTETVICGWSAVGECENCDAQLIVNYREDQ